MLLPITISVVGGCEAAAAPKGGSRVNVRPSEDITIGGVTPDDSAIVSDPTLMSLGPTMTVSESTIMAAGFIPAKIVSLPMTISLPVGLVFEVTSV